MTVPALVGGRDVEGPVRIEVRRKDTGEPIDDVAAAGPPDIDEAASQAAAAFDACRRQPAHARAAVLARARGLLEARRDEIARKLAAEAGKPIRAARAEVERCLHTIQTGAEEATRMEGEALPLDAVPHAAGRLGLTRRFPIGPVLAITPFNFPLNLVAHKLVPAVAAGCPVVCKPASATPLSALALGRLLVEAGALPGSVSVIPSRAADAERLVGDARLRLLTFTGSADVGWRLRARAGSQRVVLELGGNAAVVVHDDADLDVAVPKIVAGAFGYAGQSCISVQRLLVHEDVARELLDRLVAATEKQVVGDVMDERTDVGPMIDEAAAERAASWTREATARGARLLAGGRREGAFLWPSVLADVPPDAPVWCQEAFAPVVAVATYRTWEEALARANDSPFGLQAGVFTRDIGRILRAWGELDVGGIMVNEVPTWRVDHMPYGGAKASGLGREGVRYAIEDMTEMRLLVLEGA